jgi:phosphoglycerol transferase
MPLALAYSTTNVNKDLRIRQKPDVYDKAGVFTKKYLSNDELSRLVVVGSNGIGVFRSLFYIDNPQSSQETIPEVSNYNLSKFPAGKEWILVVGDHSLSEKPFFQLPMDGFTLVRVTGKNKH